MTLRTTSGKSCPLPTIWVPIRTPAGARSNSARMRPCAPRAAALSESRRKTGSGSTSDATSSRSARSPRRGGSRKPSRSRDTPRGTRLGMPAVVTAKRPSRARCRTSETSQFGQRHARPHSWQLRCGDHPRRGTMTIAFPPFARGARRAPRAFARGAGPRARRARACRRSRPAAGRRRPPAPGARRRSSRSQLSGRGVAEPATSTAPAARAAAPRHVAGVVAGVGLLLVGRVVLLVDDDQAESGDRGEHRRPRADADPRLAAPQALPLVAPLALAERRVQDRHPVAEARLRTARRSAESARSRARERSRRAPARAPPRSPRGRPRSCRSRSPRSGAAPRRSPSNPASIRATAPPGPG